VLASHWRRRLGLEITHIDPETDDGYFSISDPTVTAASGRRASWPHCRTAIGGCWSGGSWRTVYTGGGPGLVQQRQQRQGAEHRALRLALESARSWTGDGQKVILTTTWQPSLPSRKVLRFRPSGFEIASKLAISRKSVTVFPRA
jgi:hypothetical protein